MNNDLLANANSWIPRSKAIIFADEDVDGICSAAIVGRRYSSCDLIFVNARTLGDKLKITVSEIEENNLSYDIDVFIVDVGINKANIQSIENSVTFLVRKGTRVYYFDSHSNKYDGKTLLINLKRANVFVYDGKIGSAAASIIQKYMGTEETQKLRLLGALSDREIKLTNKYKNEKQGLRALQAAVAWGAYKDTQFLEKITMKLMRNPDLDLESDRDILEFAIKANNHRDNLLRHVFKKASVLTISETPRILAVMVLDRNDFGKARGTIAGRLAGEWGAAILLITRSVSESDSYAVTIRNSYNHKLDLEILGQLSKTKNSGGSKGAYRLTIKKDNLLLFLAKVQEWSNRLPPPWYSKRRSGPQEEKPVIQKKMKIREPIPKNKKQVKKEQKPQLKIDKPKIDMKPIIKAPPKKAEPVLKPKEVVVQIDNNQNSSSEPDDVIDLSDMDL
ncbi:MAG: hypothetical protein INQ03_06415 [Candidatus Heimdallarchaeota archaeon]|nr:hypothetical protein [Candidatus Heimdallarchaeota archaeon]